MPSRVKLDEAMLVLADLAEEQGQVELSQDMRSMASSLQDGSPPYRLKTTGFAIVNAEGQVSRKTGYKAKFVDRGGRLWTREGDVRNHINADLKYKHGGHPYQAEGVRVVKVRLTVEENLGTIDEFRITKAERVRAKKIAKLHATTEEARGALRVTAEAFDSAKDAIRQAFPLEES